MDGSVERVRIIRAMNENFQESYYSGGVDRLCRVSIGAGDPEFAHEMSSMWIRSGFRVSVENDLGLADSEVFEISDYILQNKNKFNTNHCTVHIRNQGTKLTWKTVSEILNKELVANNIVVFDTKLNGYKLIGTEEQLRTALIPNTVMDIHRCLRHDNVIKTIRSISEWIQSMQNKKTMF